MGWCGAASSPIISMWMTVIWDLFIQGKVF